MIRAGVKHRSPNPFAHIESKPCRMNVQTRASGYGEGGTSCRKTAWPSASFTRDTRDIGSRWQLWDYRGSLIFLPRPQFLIGSLIIYLRAGEQSLPLYRLLGSVGKVGNSKVQGKHQKTRTGKRRSLERLKSILSWVFLPTATSCKVGKGGKFSELQIYLNFLNKKLRRGLFTRSGGVGRRTRTPGLEVHHFLSV